MNARLITITEYCSIHDLDPVFLTSLAADGLITFTVIDNQTFLKEEQLPELETFIRWYIELGLNTEGIDVVNQLLQKIRSFQEEIKMLKTKISLYELTNNP
jgi:hypothetical protein